MTPFLHAHAAGRGWADCVDACVERIGDPGSGLGFLYLTSALAPDAARIVRALRERTGVPDWVGTTGIGVIGTGTEYVDEPALSMMVADIEPESYRVFSGKSRPPHTGERTPQGALAANFAVVHADPGEPDVAGLITDMSAKLESGYMIGGLSSGRGDTLQVANDVLRGGLSGVVLASDVMLRTRHTQGCAQLGPRLRVSEAEGNVIARLDGRPALDAMLEAVGIAEAGALRRMGHMLCVGLAVPGSDTGDYLVRDLVGVDPDARSIAIGDYPEPGAELFFCLRGGEAAERDLRRMLEALAGNGQTPARGALYYACLGRGEHMFGRRGAELGMLREALGDLPVTGFFCNGEISHNRLYGYTGVLTLFE
jgi:small ligand-binding sensory domain FIST